MYTCVCMYMFHRHTHVFIPIYKVRTHLEKHGENIYSRFSGNSGAFASELLENFEELLPSYYMPYTPRKD